MASLAPSATSTVRRVSFQDCNNRRPAWRPTDGDQPGPLQLIQAPGGREPGEAELGPIVQRQLELGRSAPTRQEPTDRRNLEGSPREPGGREPPSSKGSAHTTADAPARPPAPGDPRRRPPACNPAPGRRTATRPARPHGGPVGPNRSEIRNPLAIASRPQRFSRRNRQQRNRKAIATRRPAPGSRQADAIQA